MLVEGSSPSQISEEGKFENNRNSVHPEYGVREGTWMQGCENGDEQ